MGIPWWDGPARRCVAIELDAAGELQVTVALKEGEADIQDVPAFAIGSPADRCRVRADRRGGGPRLLCTASIHLWCVKKIKIDRCRWTAGKHAIQLELTGAIHRRPSIGRGLLVLA